MSHMSQQGAARMTSVRPSEVTDWLRCPRYWQYKHVEGWQAPPSAWTPQMLMGTAIHAGLANYWKVKRAISDVKPNEVVIQIKDPHMAMEMALRSGWPADAPEEYSYEVHEAQAGRVLSACLRWIDQEMADASPVLVEDPLGVDGRTTPDLVTREPVGLVVTDWKYSHEVSPDRVKYRLEGAERVHQFWHYIWAVGEHLKEPVAMFRKVVIIGGPKIMVKDTTFRPTKEGLAQWLESAEKMWRDMISDRVVGTSMNPNGCKMYGDKWPCSYYEACWSCYGDRTKMAQFYTKGG